MFQLSRNHQIDLLKSLAIISVIVIHTVPPEFLLSSYATLHFWEAVPIFLIIIGVNLSLYYSKYNFTNLNQYYSQNMLYRCKRILPAFLVTFLIAWLFSIARGKYYLGWRTWLGVLPIGAPGNYFLTIILELLIVAPLLVYFYRKNPVLSLIVFLTLDVLFEILTLYVFKVDDYIYHSSFFRVLIFITLGLYLGKELINGRLPGILKNKIILVGILVSVTYFVVYVFLGWSPYLFGEYGGALNIWSAFYPFLIVVIALNISLERFIYNPVVSLVLLIGKASYHIFLIQLLYFGLRFGVYERGNIILVNAVIINLAYIIGIGIAFYYSEKYLWKLVGRIRFEENCINQA